MLEGKAVPDSVFREIEESSKRRLSEMIRHSGLPVMKIAQQTGIGRAAIRRAIEGKGIRFDTAVRLEYFLQWHSRNRNNNN